MKMNFEDFKNDTARSNGARDMLVSIVEKAMQEYFGEDSVISLDKKIVFEHGGEIPPHTVCVCMGQTKDKDGYLVDVVATITPKVKKWNTTAGRRTTYAISFDDIIELVENENEIE